MVADPRFLQETIRVANGQAEEVRLHSDNARVAAIENFVQLWAGVDFASARDWILGQQAGDLRDTFIVRAGFAQSQSAPADAAAWIVDQLPPGPVQREAAMSVLHQWALRDFASATAWVTQFPEGEFRDRAIAELKGVVSYSESATPSR